MTDSFQAKVDEATSAVLNCLTRSLLEVGALCQSSGLTASHLPDPWSYVYSALMEAWKQGEQYDYIALRSRLRMNRREIPAQALSEQLSIFCPPSVVQTHISALLEAHAARRMHELGSRLVLQAFDTSSGTQELLESVRKEIETIDAAPQVKQTSVQHFSMQIFEELSTPEEHHQKEAIHFGLGLDEGAGPFYRGDMIVVAAETAGGKSALMGNIVENAASAGSRCGVFSFEMTGKQNAERMLASQACVNIRDLRAALRLMGGQGMTSFSREATEIAKITHAIARMKDWKVEIFEDSHSIEHVTAKMARMKASGGLDLAAIDYAQLVKGLKGDKDNREREVASIPREFKKACMKLECVGVLLSQLNEQGRLRESRALGQDANCVFFLEDDGSDKKVRVGKARSAPPGTEIPLQWEPGFTKFIAK